MDETCSIGVRRFARTCGLGIALAVMLPNGPMAAATREPLAVATAPKLADGIAAFQRGFEADDPRGIEQAVSLFAAICAREPMSIPAHYWHSAASLASALQALRRDSGPDATRTLRTFLQQAEEAARAALALCEDSGEVHAHLATLIGLSIAQRPSTALWRGAAVQRHARRALALAPDNPRVHYLLGAAQAGAPQPHGDPARALEHLRKAEQLFVAEQQDPPEPSAPRWGHCHTLHAIADLMEAAGETGPAQGYRERARALCPNLTSRRPGAADSATDKALP